MCNIEWRSFSYIECVKSQKNVINQLSDIECNIDAITSASVDASFDERTAFNGSNSTFEVTEEFYAPIDQERKITY